LPRELCSCPLRGDTAAATMTGRLEAEQVTRMLSRAA
jgi:hypothetical protein